VGLVDLWVLKCSRLKNRELVAIVVVARGRRRRRRRYCDLSTTNRAQGVCVLTTLYRKQRNVMQCNGRTPALKNAQEELKRMAMVTRTVQPEE